MGHVRNLTDEEKLARALDKRLWALNKVTLILAGRLRAKITLKDFKAFVYALRAIVKADQNEQKFFTGFAGVVYGDTEKHGEFFTMEVKNPDFLEVDPGRYLGGAREGALIPYDVSEIGKPAGDAAMKAYIMQHTEPWRYKEARKAA